jgi:hypothetical protein
VVQRQEWHAAWAALRLELLQDAAWVVQRQEWLTDAWMALQSR